MKKFIYFKVSDEENIIFEVVIDEETLNYYILKNIGFGLEEDLKKVLNKKYEVNIDNKIFSTNQDNIIDRLKSYNAIQYFGYKLTYNYEILELYKNLEIKINFSSLSFNSQLNFEAFDKLNDFYTFFNFFLNKESFNTKHLLNMSNNNINLTLFSNKSGFYLKETFIHFINDIESESASFVRAKENKLYFNFYKYFNRLILVDNLNSIEFCIDDENYTIKNTLYISYIYEEIYNTLYKKIKVKVKGTDNSFTPKNMSVSAINQINNVVDEVSKSSIKEKELNFKQNNNVPIIEGGVNNSQYRPDFLETNVELKTASFEIDISTTPNKLSDIITS